MNQVTGGGSPRAIIQDEYKNEVEATMLNQLKIAEAHRICGGVFGVATNGDAPDANFWATTNAAGAVSTVIDAELLQTTTTTSGSSTQNASQTLGRYMAGCMNYYRSITRVGDVGAVNNVRRFGCADLSAAPTNGYFFQLAGTVFGIVSRKNGADTVVASGSFNGEIATYALDTNYHTFEIYYTNKRVQFVVDGVLIHTITATTTPLTSTKHFRAYSSNINTGVGSVVIISHLVQSITRYGTTTSQPKAFYQAGLIAAKVLKIGAGAVHSLNISGITTGAIVTIYDGLTTGGTVLYSTGAMVVPGTTNNLPFTISLDGDGGVLFNVGLTIAITTAAANCLVKYE